MKLIECARAAGVSADTLRHYVKEGLVQAQGRTDAGYRTFSASAVARIRFIRSALALGFSLRDVAELIGMSDKGELPCPRARVLLEEHLARQRAQLEAMELLYQRMKQAMRDWRSRPDGVPDGHSVCGLIEGTSSDFPAVPVAIARRRSSPR